MTAVALLTEFGALGVALSVAGDRLCVDTPAGILSDDHWSALAAHKAELLALLSVPEPPPPAEPEPEPEPETEAEFWRSWLAELHTAGHVARHLGAESATEAWRLVDHPDPSGVGEQARDLVLRTMAGVWPERYRAAASTENYHSTGGDVAAWLRGEFARLGIIDGQKSP